MIERPTVGTLRSLEEATVDFGLANVFIGANGSGKSKLPEAPGAAVSAPRRPERSVFPSRT